MADFNIYNKYNSKKREYNEWRYEKDFQAEKRQEYLRRNPNTIKDYDLQRAKILLNAVDIMDKSISKKSNKSSVAIESITNLGLGYSAVGGATIGFLLTKLKFVNKAINKFVEKVPKSKNIVPITITSTCGVLGILLAYPFYTSLCNIESKINRKRKFETIENELQNPKIFVVLDENQKIIFKKNLDEMEKKEKSSNFAQKEIKNIKQIINETTHYSKEQAKFREKYKEDETLYEKPLTEEEIKNAKKDKALLLNLIKELNLKSQSYNEKMQRITDNIITASFALGSFFALGYERIAKKMQLKTSSLPTSLGVFLLISSTFFATWAQKRASHVGNFLAKKDLMQNPEQLIYISKTKTNTIEDNEIELSKKQKTNSLKFIKEFFKYNKEYKEWKKKSSFTGKDISKALENIDISPEQLSDGKRLQKNLFKTFYKIDKNTQNYSSEIDVISESIKYPTTLILGTIGSVLGMKYLAKLRSTNSPQEILTQSMKYIAIISLFTIPSMFINSFFAKMQKYGARISDMKTMKELEDYRFFVDYSKFEEK